jgi:hypothetical protein
MEFNRHPWSPIVPLDPPNFRTPWPSQALLASQISNQPLSIGMAHDVGGTWFLADDEPFHVPYLLVPNPVRPPPTFPFPIKIPNFYLEEVW